MLAPRQISQDFLQWNKKNGSPFGFPLPLAKKLKRILPKKVYWRLRGPFSIQRNNTTRAFEYPFVYELILQEKSEKVVDIGGGLSGFQFVLAREGYQVVNVDPGMDASGKGWPCTVESINQLNNLYGTDVALKNTTIDKANLQPGSIDVAVSVSVIEHLPWTDVENAMRSVWAALKPGGRFVLTIDLFLDVFPFDTSYSNKYGTNIDIKKLIEISPFTIELGKTSELFGFEDFDPEKISNAREKYLIGEGYPSMVQCLVLRKPLEA